MTTQDNDQGKNRLTSTALAWAGAVVAGGLNAGILAFWARGGLGHKWTGPLTLVSTAVCGYIGYYFSRKIAGSPSFPRGIGFGAVAGLLVGAINGTCVMPVVGTGIGAGVGLAAGLMCGAIMALTAQVLVVNNDGEHKTAAADESTPAVEAAAETAASLPLRLAGIFLAVAFSPLPWLAFAPRLGFWFSLPHGPALAVLFTAFAAAAAALLFISKITASASGKDSINPGAACCALAGGVNGAILFIGGNNLIMGTGLVLICAFLGLLCGFMYGPALRALARFPAKAAAAVTAALFLLPLAAAGGAYKYTCSAGAAWQARQQKSAEDLAERKRMKAEVTVQLAGDLNREAGENYRNSDFDRARQLWEQVLYLDPANAEAAAGLKRLEQRKAASR